MVSVIENWTDMEGLLVSFEQSQTLEDFLTAKVTIEKASDVEGFTNLLKDKVGKTIDVFIPKGLATELQLEHGIKLKFRARTGRYNIFVNPDVFSVSR